MLELKEDKIIVLALQRIKVRMKKTKKKYNKKDLV